MPKIVWVELCRICEGWVDCKRGRVLTEQDARHIIVLVRARAQLLLYYPRYTKKPLHMFDEAHRRWIDPNVLDRSYNSWGCKTIAGDCTFTSPHA